MIRFSLMALMTAMITLISGFSLIQFDSFEIGKSLVFFSIMSFTLSMLTGILAEEFKYKLNTISHKKFPKKIR